MAIKLHIPDKTGEWFVDDQSLLTCGRSQLSVACQRLQHRKRLLQLSIGKVLAQNLCIEFRFWIVKQFLQL